jgi:hypothetical protein
VELDTRQQAIRLELARIGIPPPGIPSVLEMLGALDRLTSRAGNAPSEQVIRVLRSAISGAEMPTPETEADIQAYDDALGLLRELADAELQDWNDVRLLQRYDEAHDDPGRAAGSELDRRLGRLRDQRSDP